MIQNIHQLSKWVHIAEFVLKLQLIVGNLNIVFLTNDLWMSVLVLFLDLLHTLWFCVLNKILNFEASFLFTCQVTLTCRLFKMFCNVAHVTRSCKLNLFRFLFFLFFLQIKTIFIEMWRVSKIGSSHETPTGFLNFSKKLLFL